MAFAVYRNGSWKQLVAAFVRVAGVWKRVTSIHARDASGWRSIWHDTFTMVIASNIDNGVNLRDRALAAGWNGNSKLNVIINSGVRISRNENDCFRVQGSFPRGVELWNYGQILGKGGAGGKGGNASHDWAEGGAWGGSGMTALLVTSPVTIHNHGTIAGGGGGGGGGSGASKHQGTALRQFAGGGGGGGGRSNAHGAPPGAGGALLSATANNWTGVEGYGGGWGTPDGPGGGGGGREARYPGSNWWAHSGHGGGGGGWGQGGGAGGGSSYSYGTNHQYPSPGGGGGQGHAVYGNQYITWAVTGQRLGIIANAS